VPFFLLKKLPGLVIGLLIKSKAVGFLG